MFLNLLKFSLIHGKISGLYAKNMFFTIIIFAVSLFSVSAWLSGYLTTRCVKQGFYVDGGLECSGTVHW